MKTCIICKKDKDINLFYKDKSKNDGLSGRCKECSKIYIINNRDILKEKRKIYNQKNKEYITEYHNNYKEINSDKLKEKRILNKYNKNEYDKIYMKLRRKNDSLFKLKNNISCRINESLRINNYTKKSRTYEILGCSIEEFKTYLESKFEPWMNWDNQGNPKDGILEFNKTWDIDHIIPLSSAKTEEEIIKLNHYSNLQPLCSKVNREVKQNKII